jgi:hypothetical protein
MGAAGRFRLKIVQERVYVYFTPVSALFHSSIGRRSIVHIFYPAYLATWQRMAVQFDFGLATSSSCLSQRTLLRISRRLLFHRFYFSSAATFVLNRSWGRSRGNDKPIGAATSIAADVLSSAIVSMARTYLRPPSPTPWMPQPFPKSNNERKRRKKSETVT